MAYTYHGNLGEGGSQMGYSVLLFWKCSFLNLESKQIKRVVRNTLATETLALKDTVNDGVTLANIISELLITDAKSIQHQSKFILIANSYMQIAKEKQP